MAGECLVQEEEEEEVERPSCSSPRQADSGIQKKINSLELNVVSLNVTIETKENMTDKMKFDLSRSESRVSRL